MEVAKVTSKGQITIPISIRRKLEINEGDKVLFIYKPEGVMMVNPNALQGGASGDVVEAAETEMATEAVVAKKGREKSKAPSKSTASKAKEPSVAKTAPKAVAEDPVVTDEVRTEPAPVAVEPEPIVKAEPATVESEPAVKSEPVAVEPEPTEPAVEPKKADPQVEGFDLDTLLDDLRSIGTIDQ